MTRTSTWLTLSLWFTACASSAPGHGEAWRVLGRAHAGTDRMEKVLLCGPPGMDDDGFSGLLTVEGRRYVVLDWVGKRMDGDRLSPVVGALPTDDVARQVAQSVLPEEIRADLAAATWSGEVMALGSIGGTRQSGFPAYEILRGQRFSLLRRRHMVLFGENSDVIGAAVWSLPPRLRVSSDGRYALDGEVDAEIVVDSDAWVVARRLSPEAVARGSTRLRVHVRDALGGTHDELMSCWMHEGMTKDLHRSLLYCFYRWRIAPTAIVHLRVVAGAEELSAWRTAWSNDQELEALGAQLAAEIARVGGGKEVLDVEIELKLP